MTLAGEHTATNIFNYMETDNVITRDDSEQNNTQKSYF